MKCIAFSRFAFCFVCLGTKNAQGHRTVLSPNKALCFSPLLSLPFYQFCTSYTCIHLLDTPQHQVTGSYCPMWTLGPQISSSVALPVSSSWSLTSLSRVRLWDWWECNTWHALNSSRRGVQSIINIFARHRHHWFFIQKPVCICTAASVEQLIFVHGKVPQPTA